MKPLSTSSGIGLERRGPGLRRGFSLVEILSALAVLALLGGLIAQIVSSTSNTTRLSNRSVDAAAQARLAFTRLGMDIAAMVRRNDVDFFAADLSNAAANTGYDSSNNLLFLSLVSSPGVVTGGNRGASLVAYRVQTHADNQGLPCLTRAGMPLGWGRAPSWGSTSFMGLKSNGLPVRLSTSDSAFPASLIPSSVSDFDVLAPGVVRMVVGFQLYPDNLKVTLKDGTLITNARGQIVYSPPARVLTANDGTAATYIDLSRVSALVVGVVAVDLESLKLLTVARANQLASSFPVPAMGGSGSALLPVQAWQPVAENVTAMDTTIPLPVRQAVRVYQRFYPITPYGSRP